MIGVTRSEKLLEDLPNKVRDILGILVEVNIREETGKSYLEIGVPAYPSPISCRGRYFQRVGSTLQELKGAALDRFLLRRQWRTWDGVPTPGVNVGDLDPGAIQRFRELAQASGRLDPEDLEVSDAEQIGKLRLSEGNYLKRAALLLFHRDPERFVTGAFVKIGFFREDGELMYHDTVHGGLLQQVRSTQNLLLTKYLKASISYKDIVRIERFPIPREALREVLLNALVHRDYAVPAPVQIRVYGDRLKVWNPAVLPEGWTLETLLGEHSSLPFNPQIANTVFRAGEIEAWGRGIQRIFKACHEAQTPEPVLNYQPNDLWLEFPFSKDYLKAVGPSSEVVGGIKTSVETSVETSGKTSEKILEILRENPSATLAEIARRVDRSVRAVELASSKLVKDGKLERVGPTKGGYWVVKAP